MFLLELNEFNFALVSGIAQRADLKNLNTILGWSRSITSTADRDESGFLEPWAQWVSVHTGEPCTHHQVKHLGDVPDLASKQLWEQLSDIGVRSGAWGVMNASRRDAERCVFFLPDPWTFSEPAYPASLAPVLELPRYLARNYLNISVARIAALFGDFLRAVIGSIGWRHFLGSLAVLVHGFGKFGPRHLVFITWFEYVAGLACLQLFRTWRPDFCVLFVNTIAHVQHHYWRDRDMGSDEILFALKVTDRLVAKILTTVPNDQPIIVTNALSQKNTCDETPWILYRQKDPEAFVRAAGFNPVSVEPLMTHDAHLIFADAQQASCAFEALKAATITGLPAFYVESSATDPKRFFYRLDFTGETKGDVELLVNQKRMNFEEHFTLVVKRTGRHIPSGLVLSRGITLPPKFENHELCRLVVQYFKANTGQPTISAPLQGAVGSRS